MLCAFIILPFIFAFLLGVSFFLKNAKHIRRISKFLYFIQFIFSSIILLIGQKTSFTFLDINFVLDKTACCFLFLISFIFFLFSIISKTFIKKLHRTFYALSFLLLGLINFAIINDNILVFLVTLFWLFLTNYLLATLFSDSNTKKTIALQLSCDLVCLLISTGLILKEFARFFIINEINFSFSILTQYLYKIDDVAIILAFFGFLIILSRLFNFIPFSAQNLSITNKINPYIFYLNSISALILGGYLFIRCYTNFDYLFYQYQDEIAIFLLSNFVIYGFLTLGQKRLFKFLNSIIVINTIVAIFSMFSFVEESCANFIYYIIALSLVYCFSILVFMVLEQKFKTDNIEEFKKIADKTKLSQFFIVASLLCLAPTPLFALFSAKSISFLVIFSTEYEGIILNIIPYCLIIGEALISLSIFTILHKIIIEPIQKAQNSTLFCNHQAMVCWILFLTLVLFSFLAQNIFKIFIVSGLD